MSQSRLTSGSRCLSAVGSAVIQRGEDVVSGRMMPTLAPLPSTAPLADELDELAEAELELSDELLSSERNRGGEGHRRRDPEHREHTLVLRMRRCPFLGSHSPGSGLLWRPR